MRTEIITALSGQGFKLFPCNADKTPATSHGFHDATAETAKLIKQFWRDDMLIGLPTGNENGIVVIDIDVGKHGDIRSVDEIKEEFESKFGSLPDTFSVETMSGGRHLYYRLESETSASSSVRTFGPEHPIDRRCNGGYVITFDDRKYVTTEPVDDLSDLRSLMAVAPDFILKDYKATASAAPSTETGLRISDNEVRELRSACPT